MSFSISTILYWNLFLSVWNEFNFVIRGSFGANKARANNRQERDFSVHQVQNVRRGQSTEFTVHRIRRNSVYRNRNRIFHFTRLPQRRWYVQASQEKRLFPLINPLQKPKFALCSCILYAWTYSGSIKRLNLAIYLTELTCILHFGKQIHYDWNEYLMHVLDEDILSIINNCLCV